MNVDENMCKLLLGLTSTHLSRAVQSYKGPEHVGRQDSHKGKRKVDPPSEPRDTKAPKRSKAKKSKRPRDDNDQLTIEQVLRRPRNTNVKANESEPNVHDPDRFFNSGQFDRG